MDPFGERSKKYYFIALCVAVAAVIISIVQMSVTIRNTSFSQEKIKSPWAVPLTSNFNYNTSDSHFQVGSTVSLDNDGTIQVGGGFSIYKDVFIERETQAKHLQVAAINEHILVSSYDGIIRVFLLNDDETVRKEERFSLPNGRQPDQMHTIHDNLLIVVSISYNELLPLTVDVDDHDNITVHFGQGGKYFVGTSIQPEFDNLDDHCLCVSFFGTNNDLTAAVGCIEGEGEGEGETLRVEIKDVKRYSPDRTFHSICGLSSTRFILAHAGSWPPIAGQTDTIGFILATFENNTITFKEGIEYTHHGSMGFFDMDNLNHEVAIVTYVDEIISNGLVALLIKYNKESDQLEFGDYAVLQDGGGSGKTPQGLYAFIYMYILSETRFGLFYSNILDGGSMCFVMAEVLPSLDIRPLGPEYVITGPNPDVKRDYYWAAISVVNYRKFFLMESLTARDEPILAIHIGDVISPPIGLITAIHKEQGIVTVAFEGFASVPESYPEFTIGKYYYSDTLGQLWEGEYAGTGEIEGITKYINHTTIICGLENRIGMAVNKHQLFLQKNDIEY
ncbi:hypothetical protein WA158_000405 [Blastocystis sp. Blastoise]